MTRRACAQAIRTTVAALGLTCGLLGPVEAQTSTGTFHGTITDETGGVLPGVSVVATHTASGIKYEATTQADGAFSLTGLRPGDYTLTASLSSFKTHTMTTRLPVAQTITLDFKLKLEAAVAEEVVVVATATAVEIKTSEVGFGVTPEQIRYLPQNSRNFLNFAGLAPGIRINDDETNKQVIASGQGARYTNVFIDGASYKNDVLEGGVAGQDASRGNPFPQNAVQEFRVLTQNFKAEYQKASSAIITATTKSGGNAVHGDAFTQYQDKNLVAIDDFAKARGFPKPTYKRWQVGASLGGPITKDKTHFFLSYEGNLQDRDAQVFLKSPNGPAELKQLEGVFPSEFRSHLGFGKLSHQISASQLLEVSGNLRHETDVRSFGDQTAFSAAENVKIDVGSVIAKHRWAKGGNVVNEATASYVRFRWNPVPTDLDQVGLDFQELIRAGGRDTEQNFLQKRSSIRDDVSYAGLHNHFVKLGGNVDFLTYDVSKRLNGNPIFRYRPGVFDIPFEASYGVGNPDLNADNRQVGLYAQDDWNVTPRLQMNLGVRWDYESDMLGNSYVTPAEVRTALGPFIDARYFTDGSQRKPFYGAIQPRVGFSYDVTGRGRTTVFAGFGRYYDRTVYNYILDERYRLQYAVRTFRFSADGSPRDGLPTILWNPSYLSVAGLNGLIASGTAPKPEVFLLDNGTRPPVSNQWSAGVRHSFGQVVGSATYTGVRSKHDLTFIFGNRRADGQCCRELAPQYSNVLLSSDEKKTWYDALFLTLEKPFTSGSRWGMSVSYTLSSSEQIGGDLFSLDFPRVTDYPRYPTDTDERHRVVASGILGLPRDFRLSALVTYGSGLPYTIDDASRGFGPNEFVKKRNGGRAAAFNTIDLRLDKDFRLSGDHRLGVSAEAFNVFDRENYGGYNGFIARLPEVNPNFGKPSRLIEPGRRLQFGLNYSF